jgi:hypothetical protein
MDDELLDSTLDTIRVFSDKLNIDAELLAYERKRSLRPTANSIGDNLHTLCYIMLWALGQAMHNNNLATINERAVDDYVLDELERYYSLCVTRDITEEDLCMLMSTVVTLITHYRAQARTHMHETLSDRFVRLGLHGMYGIPKQKHSDVADVGSDHTDCVVCYDGERTTCISTACAHPVMLCAPCAERLDTCPICCIAR